MSNILQVAKIQVILFILLTAILLFFGDEFGTFITMLTCFSLLKKFRIP